MKTWIWPAPSAAEAGPLQRRLGQDRLRRRLALEHEQDEHHYRRRADAFRPEHLASAGPLITAVLTLTGLRGRARRNARAIRLRRHEVTLRNLPWAFDGYTLLQLSDLHLDASAEHAAALAEAVRGVACDACVLTGDYRFATGGTCEPAIAALARLVPALPHPAYAVLGNHDGIAIAAALERLGVHVLVNERLAIDRPGGQLAIAGIDDAHYFRTHDVARAAQGLGPDACAVLLSHTPQPFEEAAAQGFALMLCGHTHGGQICLPGGLPILTDCPAPRWTARGAWRHGGMQGYTSAGCGSSIVEARFFCPPEIVLHTLRRAPTT